MASDHLSEREDPSERVVSDGRERLAFAFDLDGTIYLGDNLLPGASELLAALEERGTPFVFATNNSSTTVAAYRQRLARLGIAVDSSRIVTSNAVAQRHLLESGARRPFMLATPEVRSEYARHGIHHEQERPDAVLLTFDTTLDYAKLREASRWLLDGVPFIATHPDLVCPTPEGPIPDCGAFIALLSAATGRTAVILGKPHRGMAETITSRLGVSPAVTAFVGDRLYTDVRMANEQGFTAVLTLTGEAGIGDVEGSPYRPDWLVADLRELLDRLDEIEASVLSSATGAVP